MHPLVIWIALVTGAEAIRSGEKKCFPNNFAFGVATAAYQIEGAWNESGKGESIWDRYTHSNPQWVFDHNNADIADDSYHQYKKDVALLVELNVAFYRFSISWPRILPDGLTNNINADGIRYYNELLSELEKHGIIPLVTMYHWDLPQPLQDLGGWTNPVIVDYFVDYARLCSFFLLFQTFGHRVTTWLTFNEPLSFCHDGYGGTDAPGARASGFEDYMCGHHVLIAHGKVYKMFKEEFGKGYVGITLDIHWMEPNTTSQADVAAAERALQFQFGWFANPIFSAKGDYPSVMRNRIDAISRRQGFRRSRLPTFTPDEVALIKGSFDFMGVNHYTSSMVTEGPGRVRRQPSYDDDLGARLTFRHDWPKTDADWLRVVPWGFRKALNWIRKNYNNPIVVVTENGVPLESGLHDSKRVQYIASYVSSMYNAMQDGCNVQGYAYWSVIDNFEWMMGFSQRFGLYHVDYNSTERTRTARLSARFFSQLAKTRCIPDDHLTP